MCAWYVYAAAAAAAVSCNNLSLGLINCCTLKNHLRTPQLRLLLLLLLMSIGLAAGFMARVAPTTQTPLAVGGNPSWGCCCVVSRDPETARAALTNWLTEWLPNVLWLSSAQRAWGEPETAATDLGYRRHLLPPILRQLITKLWYDDLGQASVQHLMWQHHCASSARLDCIQNP